MYTTGGFRGHDRLFPSTGNRGQWTIWLDYLRLLSVHFLKNRLFGVIRSGAEDLPRSPLTTLSRSLSCWGTEDLSWIPHPCYRLFRPWTSALLMGLSVSDLLPASHTRSSITCLFCGPCNIKSETRRIFFRHYICYNFITHTKEWLCDSNIKLPHSFRQLDCLKGKKVKLARLI